MDHWYLLHSDIFDKTRTDKIIENLFKFHSYRDKTHLWKGLAINWVR